uniref:Integrase catalytic domain-containing protein n=1 Tax=Tanacetum cinerariifolium TaxID=118510 RepID=A0A6L2KP84_TANCI|nr:hypothetical protein [Tanacetum cinerariifolium]
MTGNYMPSGPDVEIDYSKFTYGPKQTLVDESDAKTCENASSESNSSIDAHIIEEYELDSDDDSVSNVLEEKETPSFAFTDYVKHVKSPRENVKETGTPNHYPKIKKQDRHSHTRKGLGYARKSCFICGSFSHLIRDCDFHEKRMAKQAALTKSREKGIGQPAHRPVWNNVKRFNHQNKFVPTTLLTKTGKIPVNTARQNFSRQAALTSTASKVNTARPFDDPHKALKDKRIVDSECSRHMTGNKAHLVDYQEFKGGSVAFGGSNGRIIGKGKIKAGRLDFEDVYYVEELKHYNLFFVSQMYDKKNKVLFTDTDCLVLSLDFKLPDENQDETTPILKDFIRQAKNQFNHKVKTIRSDNGTEFKNQDLIESYGLKGIKMEYSNAKTPQQNKVAERKNMTLIEAARTMLADSFLPTRFWAETVNTACYVLNRVLVTKPQNKIPYELLTGTQPIISYLRPFGCHVTILNTIDQLGKLDGKSDLGFLVGYSLNSPKEANNSAGTQVIDDQGENSEEIDLHDKHFVLPIWFAYSTTVKSSGDKFKKNKKPVSQVEQIFQEELEKLKRQEKEANDVVRKEATHDTQDTNTNSTNLLNAVSAPVSAVGPSGALNDAEPSYPDDPSMPHLEDIFASPSEWIFTNSSYDDEGVITDFNNLETTMNASPTPTTRIHTIHPKTQILRDPMSAVQTRSKVHKNSEAHALKVWILVDLPFGKKAIGTKWVYMNKKEERGVVVRNKACLVAQGHRQEEGIDYDEVFAPVERIKAIRIFLAFASYMGFIVYQMDVKSAFLYGTIDEEVYVTQTPGFVDPKFPNKVYKVVKVVYGLHQALRAWYATLSTFLERNCYYSNETQKPLVKDEEAADVDVHLYRSMIVSLTYLTASRPDIMFTVCDCSRFYVTHKTSHLQAVKRIFRYLKGQPKLGIWYPKVSSFDLEAYSDSDYAGANLDRKSITGGCQFLDRRLISWQCKKQTIMATSTTKTEYVVAAHYSALLKGRLLEVTTAKQRLQLPSIGVNTPRYDEDSLELKELMVFFVQFVLRRMELEILLFCLTAKVKTVNDEVRVQALIDAKRVNIKESSIRCALRLDDEEGISCLANDEIFTGLADMGYEKISEKLTFYKAFFSSPMEFPNPCYIAVPYLVKNIEAGVPFYMFPRFVQLIVVHQLGDMSHHQDIYDNPSLSKKVFANMKRVGTSFPGVITLLFENMLVPAAEEVDMDEVVEVNLQEEQAKAYNLDLQHSKKVLSMQDIDEEEPAEVEEVLEVVTAAKLMTEVVSTAARVQKASALRRRRGVVIHDPKETIASVIVRTEVQPKDKGKGILIKEPKPLKCQAQIKADEAFARQLEAELNENINWNDVIEQVKRSKRQNNKVMGYQALKRKPLTEAQAKATPLASKVPVGDYQIHHENNKPYYKIIRADGTHKFETTEPKNFSNDFLLNILKIMFEKPNIEASVWKDQKGKYGLAKVKSWKLFKSCGIHIITFTTTQMILLVEKKYPLTHFTL